MPEFKVNLLGGLGSFFKRFPAMLEKQSLNLPKTTLVPCWTALLTFSAITLHEEVLLGKRRDFKGFLNSSVIHFIYFKIIFFSNEN